MRVVVIDAALPFVTTAQVRAHTNLDVDAAETAYLEMLVAAACGHLDGPDGALGGRAIGEQTLEARFSAYECTGGVRLPVGPVIEVEQVSYLDPNRQPVIVDPADWMLVGADVAPVGTPAWSGCWLGPEVLTVRYRAGYEDGAPPALKVAAMMMVADWYRNRETVVVGAPAAELPLAVGVRQLVAPFMVYR